MLQHALLCQWFRSLQQVYVLRKEPCIFGEPNIQGSMYVVKRALYMPYIYLTATHTATHCNTLQHTASHCNTMQQ